MLTKEDMELLEYTYGLKPQKEVFLVRDGMVSEDDKVWWWKERGPDYVEVKEHADNIRKCGTSFYSINCPRTEVRYMDLEG